MYTFVRSIPWLALIVASGIGAAMAAPTVYIPLRSGNHVIAVDGATAVVDGKVVKTYKLGEGLHGLDIGDDGKTLFVNSKKEDKLVAVDTQTGSQRTLLLSPSPYHLNTIRGTGKVYVSSRKEPKIWVIEQEGLKVMNTINLPAGEGHQMAIVN